MYFKKVVQFIQKKHQEGSIILVVNHSYEEVDSLFKYYFNGYQYVSLKQKNNLNLLRIDPYKFFNLYDEKIIFDHLELEPKFVDLLLNYAMGIYRKENYLLVTKIDTQKYSKDLCKIVLHPLQNDEFELAKRIYSDAFSSQQKKKFVAYTKFILAHFEEQLNIHHAEKLKNLIHLLSQHLNKSLNVNHLAKQVRLSQPTVQKWLDELENLGLIVLLQPLETSYGKRVSKTPKLYFKNCRFLCYLLGLKDEEQVLRSPLFFDLVTNFYLLELLKANELDTQQKKYAFWRESNGHEVKFMFQNPTSLDVFDFTSSHEVQKQDLKELEYFDYLTDGEVLSKTIIYDGMKELVKNGVRYLPWRKLN
jgi:uncharacterized protein